VRTEGDMCEACGKRPATFFVTDITDGQAVEHHLCQQCYTEREGASGAQSVFQEFLARVAPALVEMGSRRCRVCGISYLEFRQTLLLGCQNDYEAFKEPLVPVLEQMHGASHHCGKVPPGAGDDDAVRSRIELLRKRQDKAVAEEDYELAADLRDRIGKLQEHGLYEPAE